MPAATNKDDLIAVTEKQYAKLHALIVQIPDAQAMQKREDDTSIKDVIAHRAHWIQLFLGWYSDGKAGRDVHFPAPGYKWSNLRAFNADLRAKQVNLDWDHAYHHLATSHQALLTFLLMHSDAELYGGPMKGANNFWTPGRWAEAAGASHFRSARKWIKKCVRADASQTAVPKPRSDQHSGTS